VNVGQGYNCRPTILPLLGQAYQPFGLVYLTMVHTCVRPRPAAGLRCPCGL